MAAAVSMKADRGTSEYRAGLALAEAIIPGSATISAADEATLEQARAMVAEVHPALGPGWDVAVRALDAAAVAYTGKPFHALGARRQEELITRWQSRSRVLRAPLGMLALVLKLDALRPPRRLRLDGGPPQRRQLPRARARACRVRLPARGPLPPGAALPVYTAASAQRTSHRRRSPRPPSRAPVLVGGGDRRRPQDGLRQRRRRASICLVDTYSSNRQLGQEGGLSATVSDARACRSGQMRRPGASKRTICGAGRKLTRVQVRINLIAPAR